MGVWRESTERELERERNREGDREVVRVGGCVFRIRRALEVPRHKLAIVVGIDSERPCRVTIGISARFVLHKAVPSSRGI